MGERSSGMSGAELKRLVTKRDRLKRELRAPELATRDRLRKEAELKGVEDKLERQFGAAGGARSVIVSEHAMVRYVQRVCGLSEEELAEKILPIAVRTALAEARVTEARVPVRGGPRGDTGEITHVAVIENSVVRTVVGVDEPHSPSDRGAKLRRSEMVDMAADENAGKVSGA